MNQQQQELYEKLLKKVNEYCLGQAAEDVIAAIDALVESYEDQTSELLEEICDKFVAIDIGLFGDRTKTYRTLEEVRKDRTFLFDHLYGYVNGKKVAKYNSREEKFELLEEVLK
jgi:hypothetical protein